MEKNQMLTCIILIPVLDYHASKNANDAVKAIVYQLGALNCKNDDICAAIRYNGILNKNTKEILTNVAEQHGHRILYAEAEKDAAFVDNDTFHIPTNDEMKTHLNWDEKVNHP